MITRANLLRCQKVYPLIAALCEKHFAHDGSISPLFDEPTQLLGGPLDHAFKSFGRDYLSKRECEIVHLILKGYSSKAIAGLLDISPETVKVHRKRFHTKLDISSQAELFSLFLEAIALVPLDSDVDPLTLYFES